MIPAHRCPVFHMVQIGSPSTCSCCSSSSTSWYWLVLTVSCFLPGRHHTCHISRRPRLLRQHQRLLLRQVFGFIRESHHTVAKFVANTPWTYHSWFAIVAATHPVIIMEGAARKGRSGTHPEGCPVQRQRHHRQKVVLNPAHPTTMKSMKLQLHRRPQTHRKPQPLRAHIWKQ